MEPFSIQCDTCHASLKVAKASLIGKRLPCPKCQTLIVVPPGPGTLESPEETDAGNNRSIISQTDSLGGFEDVDDLLSQLPHAESTNPASTTAESSHPDSTQKRSRRREDSVNLETAPEPISAEVTWDNPAATQARRILGWVAVAAGTILVGAIGLYAWFNLTPSVAPRENVAASKKPAADDSEPADAGTPRVEPKELASVETTPRQPQLQPQKPEKPAAVDGFPDDNSRTAMLDQTAVDSTPPPIEIDDAGSTNNLSETPPIPSPVASSRAGNPNPVGHIEAEVESPKSGIRQPGDEILKPVAPAQSALSELSALLEESGSSISAITDATASVAAADTIGLPKYYFQATQSAPIDIKRQLRQPCLGLRYTNVPVIDILRDVTLISGIPISIDTALIPESSSRQRFIPNISLEISDTDFRDAIELIANQAGWTSTETETGISLAPQDAAATVERTIDLTPIAKLGDQSLDGVVETVKAMIAGESWYSDPTQFKIARNDMTLEVKHIPAVAQQVQRFVDKTSAAIRLTDGSPDSDLLRETLRTRLGSAAPRLAGSCKLSITSTSTLDDLLSRIRTRTDMDVIANWETLSTLGWTPQMLVPGTVSEPTLEEMLRQLERSSNGSAIVLDSSTIELTSPVDAMQRGYVEFYLISDLFQRNFTPERTIQLVQEAIQSAARPAATTTIYEPKCQCIILSAPQSIHRVVETVLGEIRKLE